MRPPLQVEQLERLQHPQCVLLCAYLPCLSQMGIMLQTYHMLGCFAHTQITSICDAVDDTSIRQMADLLVEDGYLKAGYSYLNLDGAFSPSCRLATSFIWLWSTRASQILVRLSISKTGMPSHYADAWADMKRGPDGKLRASPQRFAAGIADLADYVHSKGAHCASLEYMLIVPMRSVAAHTVLHTVWMVQHGSVM